VASRDLGEPEDLVAAERAGLDPGAATFKARQNAVP
jgi:hypothetical protein